MTLGGLILPFLAGAALTIPEADAKFIMGLGFGDQPGSLVVELVVAPDHVVEGCRVLAGASKVRAERMCNDARKLKVPDVALDREGRPVHGFLYVARVPRAGYGRREAPGLEAYPTDLQIEVQEIPGAEIRKMVSVLVLNDETGSVAHCEYAPEDKTFATVACQEVSLHRWPIVQDGAGTPVRHVRPLRVEFVERPTVGKAGYDPP